MGYGFNMLSIDIGSDKIKFVYGVAGKRKIRVRNMFCIPTPKEAISSGEIVNVGLMREVLTVAVKNNKFTGASVFVTTQSGAFISREFTVPLMKNAAETESVLRFEVEQSIPINVDEYVLSYRELERFKVNAKNSDGKENEKKGKKKVSVRVKYFVGLLPKRMVASYYELLRAVKLKPVGMDVNVNSIDKILEFDMRNSVDKSFLSDTIMTVDIGHDAMDMTIFERGLPQINRTVPIGGAEMTRAISDAMGLGYEEAEIIKLQNVDMTATTAANPEDAILNDIVRTVVADWIEQMRRMLDYYYTTRTGKHVDRVYIYGGSSSITGLVEYLKENLGINIKIIDTPELIKIKKSSPAPMCVFMNALGAIIRK